MTRRQIDATWDDDRGTAGVAPSMDDAGELDCSRRALQRHGALLGWSEGEVARFAEGAVGRRWERLDAADLAAVVEEFRATMRLLTAARPAPWSADRSRWSRNSGRRCGC